MFAILGFAVSHSARAGDSDESISPVTYLDEYGVECECNDYTVITNSTNDLHYHSENWYDGWYVVTNNVTIAGQLNFSGPVTHLILADGATLTVTNGNDSAVNADSLIIYGQTNNTGMLTAIGTYCGINIWSLGVNGGNIVAIGNYCGICSYNNDIWIDSGTLTANGGYYGIYTRSAFTVNGGTVSVSGGICAHYIFFRWADLSDHITVDGYEYSEFLIYPGLYLTDGYNVYSNYLDSAQVSAITGKTLRPYLAAPTFPAYLDGADDQVKTNYLSWAMRNGYDINSEHETVFLLNVSPSAAPVELCIDDIEVIAGGVKIRVTAKAGGTTVDLSAANGVLAVAAGDNLASLAPVALPAANVTYNAGAATILIPSSTGSFVQALIRVATPPPADVSR